MLTIYWLPNLSFGASKMAYSSLINDYNGITSVHSTVKTLHVYY